MKQLFLICHLMLFLSLSSELRAEHNLFPCEYICEDIEHVKASESIFDNLMYSKSDISKKDPPALLKHINAFEPEIAYILYRERHGHVLQRIIASTNIRDLIHVTARNNNIHTKDIPHHREKLSDLLSPTVQFKKSTKNNLKKAGLSYFDDFQ